MSDSRFIVGIDLGTTNIAVYYVDTEDESLTIRPFPITQVVAPGEVAARSLLPSFCYLPAAESLPAGSIALPWAPNATDAVGEIARDFGSGEPRRQVFSAKSWLAHAGIDRTKPILPWGGELGERMLSPIQVTTQYLSHIRAAWDHEFGRLKDVDGEACLLADQQAIITVPASFDETARELTLEAARQSGFKKLTLLEEPLAAFYAWLNCHNEDWKEQLQPGECVLVVDIGGGTSDFSIIQMNDDGALQRFAVGDHLLLGGDNIDMAIAREIEQGWSTKLPHQEWTMLVQHCRKAKEQILEDGHESVDITLLSRGSSVLSNVRRATITQDRMKAVLEAGFYPIPDRDMPSPRRASGMRQMGLPYASEPAVTVHLLNFLRYAAQISPDCESNVLYPHKVLFNGGSMKADLARDRVLEALRSWFPEQPAPIAIPGEDLSLAVAVGAAYYGRVRRGAGVKVRGGISRSYFIQATGKSGDDQFVCVMSRDTDESIPVTVPGSYLLQTNQKVLFNLYSSATRLQDQPGDIVPASDDLSQVAPLVSVLRYGKGEQSAIEVEVQTELTETGTLEITLASAGTSHRWPLRFDLRPIEAELEGEREIVVVEGERLDRAKQLIHQAFTGSGDSLKTLFGELETALDLPRDEWSLPLLRDLYDACAKVSAERKRTPQHEHRWLNLAGYCLRPGFGDPADHLRVREIWKEWFSGPAHARQPQAVAEWWVFWRRLAPGLKPGHHVAIADVAEKLVLPKGKYQNKIREGDQARQEIWRCLGALEKLPVKRKKLLGLALVGRLRKLSAWEYWVLARLGARHLFHAPANSILPASEAGVWARAILACEASGQARKMRLFALSLIASQTRERHLDLPPKVQAACLEALADAPEAWASRLSETQEESSEENARILGDSLPLGLSLLD